MTAPDIPRGEGGSRRIRWATIGRIALLMYPGIFALLSGTTWALEGEVEFVVTAALALVTTVLIVLLVPVSFFVMFYALVAAFLLIAYVGCDDIPLSVWPRCVRTLLRSAILAACVAWIAQTIPALSKAPTWKAFQDAALLGVVLPASIIFWLFMSRIEGIAKRFAETGGPEGE